MADLGSNIASFGELTMGLRRIREYVEPTDANGGTYSQRIFELLMSTCEQFEGACKAVLISNRYPKDPETIGAADFATLAGSHGLPGSVVTAHFWRPKGKGFRPFKEWTDPLQSLPWMVDYGILKNNRHTEYRRANLLTLVESMAGLFLFLCRAERSETPKWTREKHEDHWHCQDGDNFTTDCLPPASLDDTKPTAVLSPMAPFPIRCSNAKCLTLFEPEGSPKIGEMVPCPRCDWQSVYDRRREERRENTAPKPPAE